MLLSDTLKWTNSTNDIKSFVAEYAQTKIRYERLKHINDMIEIDEAFGLGYTVKHDCPLSLLREQQRAMGEFLHTLELQAIIQHIDLDYEISRMISGEDSSDVDDDNKLRPCDPDIPHGKCIFESGK